MEKSTKFIGRDQWKILFNSDMCHPTHSTIVCRYYKNPPSCVSTFSARIYYVVHKLPTVTRACIHFGSHNHHVSIGGCCESIMTTKELMKLEVEKNQS